MTGIVERLRACHGIQSGDPDCCCQEAACEIERLRAALQHIVRTDKIEYGLGSWEDGECARIARAALAHGLPPMGQTGATDGS